MSFSSDRRVFLASRTEAAARNGWRVDNKLLSNTHINSGKQIATPATQSSERASERKHAS